MSVRDDGAIRSARDYRSRDGGAIPASSLHFRIGAKDQAEDLVLRYHYSKRIPVNIMQVGSLHLPGGLFGDYGECVAAIFYSIPPARWSQPVVELSRLVRVDGVRVPLTFLISMSLRWLKKQGWDLVISFADTTQGHEGYVYQAASWNYDGQRDSRMDGVLVDGEFIPGRTANHLYGTRSPTKLSERFNDKKIEGHFDTGKHLYWKNLTEKGAVMASELKLKKAAYPKKTQS